MIRIYLRNIARFITVILLQVLILDNVQFNGYLSPFFYVIFIVLLPFEAPNWLLITLGFLLGLSVDLFNGTPGMHAAATVFIAFLRPSILNYLAPRDGYESGTFPRVHYYGLYWFIRYTLILVLAHHLVLFFIDTFRFSDIFFTLFRILLNTVITSLLIILSQFFIYRK
jgi:rod shape-determining protein MreD